MPCDFGIHADSDLIKFEGGEIHLLVDFGMIPTHPLSEQQKGLEMDFPAFMQLCGRFGYKLADSFKMQVNPMLLDQKISHY